MKLHLPDTIELMEIDSIVKASKGLHSPNNAMQIDHRAGFTMIWPTSILKNFSIWPSPYAPNDFLLTVVYFDYSESHKLKWQRPLIFPWLILSSDLLPLSKSYKKTF